MNTALVYIFFSNKSQGSKVLDAKRSASDLMPLLQIEDASDLNLKDKHALHILLITSQKACVISVRSGSKLSEKGSEVNEKQCAEQDRSNSGQILMTFDQISPNLTNFRALARKWGNSTGEYWEEDFIPASEKLYRSLITPIDRDLKGIDHLTFIMDRGLRSLPLAALSRGQETDADGYKSHSYLVQKYGVGLAPSYSLLRTDYQKFPDCNGQTCNEKLWVLGASTFLRDKEPLLLAELQMNTLSEQIWGAKNSKVFKDEHFKITQLQACPPNAKSNDSCRSDVRLVHLVTHANFSKKPSDSYIYFGKGEKLDLTKVQSLHLDSPPPPPIELFVLTAACETAVGNESAELGFAGAAVKTRVKTVMATLWQVEEISTLAFNLEFYQYLKRGKTKSSALREAQKAMISGQTKISLNKDGSYEIHTSLDSHFSVPRMVKQPGTQGMIPSPTKELYDEKARQDKKPQDAKDRDYLKNPKNLYFKHPVSWAAYTLIGTPW
jgi:CHAT domain-containing protein